jgi:hypothetical protein
MNYFVDEGALEIPEKNIYTATEIVTLIPAPGSLATDKFFEVNSWANNWLPAYTHSKKLRAHPKDSLLKKFLEWFFDNSMGERLDNFLFKWTSRRWKNKEEKGKKNSKGRIMNLVTGKHFSKSNPEAFQQKIVALYEIKAGELEALCLNR